MTDSLKAFERLQNIVAELREKCPWDRKQTFDSLRHLTIEETYELADAITAKDTEEIKEELGDLLLHVLMYSQIASETNDFTIADVANKISDKMVERHPHIYGDVKADTAEEVKKNWEKIKLKKKKNIFSGVPKALPAMIKAYRIQEKAAQTGFDWEKKEEVWHKLEEELKELQQAIQANDKAEMENEMGDVLFSLINFARFINVDPDNALEKTNLKFMKRYAQMQELAEQEGKQLANLSLDEMDELWNKVKTLE